MSVRKTNSVNYLVGSTPPSRTGAAGTQGLVGLFDAAQQADAAFRQSVEQRRRFNRAELCLRNRTAPLNDANRDSIFNVPEVHSSSEDTVAAVAGPGAGIGDYEVAVGQLALGRVILGDALAAEAPAPIAAGPGGFGQIRFMSNGDELPVSYQIPGGAPGETALRRIAASINIRSLAITARVAIDSDKRTVRLMLEGTPGAGDFTVGDNLGNVAAVTGIDNPANVTRDVRNSAFMVNGDAFEAAGNTVALGDASVILTLKKITDAEFVTISVKPQTGRALDEAVRRFVTQYNDTYGRIASEPLAFAQTGLHNLRHIASRGADDLRGIGIDVTSAGRLHINEPRFRPVPVESPGQIQEAFNGGTRFAAGVQAETERAISQSLAHPSANGFTELNTNIFSYGYSLDSFIAKNIGLFINMLY